MKKRLLSLVAAGLLLLSQTAVFPAGAADAPGDLSQLSSYTLYNNGHPDKAFRQEGDTFVSQNDVGVSNKAMVNGLENVSDFTARFTVTLDQEGRAFCGLYFRTQSVGDGQDSVEGYQLLFDRVVANDNVPRFDLSLHKMGPKSEASTASTYIGQVGSAIRHTTGRATDEAESAILKPYGTAPGLQMIVEVTVIGRHIWAFARLAEEPEVVSAALNCELDAPISGDPLNRYYEAGGIGLFASTDTSHNIVNTISDFEITTDVSQVHEGVFSDFDDFYFFSEDTVAGFHTLSDGTFGGDGSGIKKALVRNCYEDGDITASVRLNRDADGNLEGGLMFHATDILQWNDKMQGYSVYVNSFAEAPDQVEIFLYKYGPDLTDTCAYLGIISPTNVEGDATTYISSGKGSLGDGVDSWVLKVKTEGTLVYAQLISEDGKVFSPVLTYDTTGSAQGGSTDIKKAVFSTGGLGVTMRRGTFTDFRIGETEVGEFSSASALVWILVGIAGGMAVLAAVTILLVVIKKKKKG